MISVIDYRAGNAPSVVFALQHLGVESRLVSSAEDVLSADRIVLPGVGAAGPTMESLGESGIAEALTIRVLGAGGPFLGICVGLQVLFDHSEEGDASCLGWMPGTVRGLPPGVRVPQIGWNGVRPTRGHPIWQGMPDEAYCYFVNSYCAVPTNPDHSIAVTDYGGSFCSIAGTGNIVATQFHAEKSGVLGLRLLANFARWDGGGC